MCKADRPCGITAETFKLAHIASESVYPWIDATMPKLKGKAGILSTSLQQRHRRVGRPVNIIHIGANDLESEVELYTTILGSGIVANMVVLEPLTPVIPALEKNLARIPHPLRRQARAINAAICPEDTNLTMSMFDIDLMDEEVIAKSRKVFGVDHKSLLRTLLSKWTSLAGPRLLADTWQRVISYEFNAPLLGNVAYEKLESAIVGYPVRCLTPKTLLSEVGVASDSVDFLFVDAEGYDAEIVQLFSEMPGFGPAALYFEWGWHHESRGKLGLLTSLARSLVAQGYDLRSDHDNLVFTLARAGAS